jgi:hypothetical protein
MFSAGDTVYTVEGQEAEYVARVGGRHLVRFIYSNRDEEPHYGRTQEVGEVFEDAPIARYAEHIIELDKEIEEKSKVVAALREEENAFKREVVNRKARILEHEKLALLDNYLAGNITHFVVKGSYGSGLTIQKFDEFMKTQSEYGNDKGFRLLSLFGDGKELTWQRHSYSDGSGGTIQCQPATSYEEAVNIAAQAIHEQWIEYATGNNKSRPWVYEGAVKTADQLGFDVPEEIREAIRQHYIKSMEGQVEDAQAKLAVAVAQYAALTAKGN